MGFSALAETLSTTTAATALFYLFAALAVGSALCVVASRNIVRTAVSLLFALLGVGGLYFLLQAEFLAAVQLVVYAGGTLILIIFGVMLTSKSPFSRFEPRRIEVIVGVIVAAIMLTALLMGIGSYVRGMKPAAPAPTTDQPYPMAKLGAALLGDFLVPFELVSVLLLVVMIGAAYLAKGRRRESEKP